MFAGEQEGLGTRLLYYNIHTYIYMFCICIILQVKQEKNLLGSPGNFAAFPTNPRDWIVMDALPEQLNHWQANALYIIGDKPVLQDIPEDLYPNCTFVPVEVRERERERERERREGGERGKEIGVKSLEWRDVSCGRIRRGKGGGVNEREKGRGREREREREKEIYQPYTHSNFNTTHYLPPPTHRFPLQPA